MQFRRPDSAKSRATQKTLDTQLNQSKFSQTFTSYTTFQAEKKDEFLRYLQQKDKDPKFKKYQQTNLPEIPQKQPKQELSKINSKPFEKRNPKIVSKAKIQQFKQAPKQNASSIESHLEESNGKWTLKIQNGTQKGIKQQINSSTSFAQKNKQKMSLIAAGLKKSQINQKKIQKNIDLKGFKVNIPGKREIKNNQEQKQAQNQFISGDLQKIKPLQAKRQHLVQKNKSKPQKSQQEIKRQQELLQISRFINQVQMKNIDYYPEGYEQFVEKNQSQMLQNLEKIDINNFLIQPTERDYEKIRRKITDNEKRLVEQQSLSESRISAVSQVSKTSNVNLSASQSSIDLDKIIDGDSESKVIQQISDRNQLYLSSISSKDLKERNLFLTEVLKGRVTKQQIMKLQEMDRSQLKLQKLENQPKQDEDIQIMEINMMKRKSNRLLERNFVEASGQIYRDCDYLSEENKQRLERLLNGEMEASPFQVSEWERFAIRRIDQGIRLYRQFSSSSNTDLTQSLIAQECLPKDPNLRKEAQRKILKEKIESVNARLHQIQNIVVSQTKIQQLIERHRTLKPSKYTQDLINQRETQIEELEQKSKLALQMLEKAERQKIEIEATLEQMEEEYKQYEKQCKQFEKLSLEEIVKREKIQISQQKKRIQQITNSFRQIQKQTDSTASQFHEEIQKQLQILQEIENLAPNTQLAFNRFNINESIEDLDAIFEKKANENRQLRQLRENLLNQQQKQNQFVNY